MSIPERLKPPVVHPDSMDKMITIADSLTELIDSGADECHADIQSLINEWNAVSVRTFSFEEFRDHHSWIGTDEFVKTAYYKASYVDDLGFHEAKEIVEFVYNAEGDEAEQGYFLELLEVNFPCANVCELIYYPDSWFDDELMFNVEFISDELVGYMMSKSNRWLLDAPEINLKYIIPDRC